MGQWENIKQEVSNIRFGSKFDAVVARMSRIFFCILCLCSSVAQCSMSVSCVDCVSSALPLYGLIARVSTHIYISTHIYTCRLFIVSIRLDTFSIVRGHTLLYIPLLHYTGLIIRACRILPWSENMHLFMIQEIFASGDLETPIYETVYKVLSLINEVWLLSSVARVCSATTHL